MTLACCSCRPGVFALAVLLSPSLASAHPNDSNSWAVWAGSQVLLSKPAGAFHPPNSDRSLGYGICAAFMPPRKPLGLRFEFGKVEHRSHMDNIRVANPNGYWVDNLRAQTGSRLSWGMIGAQWDMRPQENSVYGYAMGGVGRISPMEVLGNGYPVIKADVPGLPGSSNGFAWSAGMGSRLRIPGRRNLAITGSRMNGMPLLMASAPA